MPAVACWADGPCVPDPHVGDLSNQVDTLLTLLQLSAASSRHLLPWTCIFAECNMYGSMKPEGLDSAGDGQPAHSVPFERFREGEGEGEGERLLAAAFSIGGSCRGSVSWRAAGMPS